MDINNFFNDTIEKFKEFDEVDCIVLGGSRAVDNDDSYSDYDVCIYI